MCIAVPLRITELNGNEAVGEQDGVRCAVRVDFIEEPKVGEYVISHAGFAIERLSEEDAVQSLAAAREVRAALMEIEKERPVRK